MGEGSAPPRQQLGCLGERCKLPQRKNLHFGCTKCPETRLAAANALSIWDSWVGGYRPQSPLATPMMKLTSYSCRCVGCSRLEEPTESAVNMRTRRVYIAYMGEKKPLGGLRQNVLVMGIYDKSRVSNLVTIG